MASERAHKEYTVGWICALPKEQTAAIAMLDETHPTLLKPQNDQNTYTLGSIGNHNIVVACLPTGNIGTTPAATAAIQMVNAFPSIKFGLMVGIGGGVSIKVRLGDVVIGTPTGTYSGVVQWDLGKEEEGGKFIRTGSLNNPPNLLLSAVSRLRSEHELNGSKILAYMDEMVSRYPRLGSKYLRSESLQDVRFKAKYEHRNDNGGNAASKDADALSEDEMEEDEEEGESCRYCDKTQVENRKPRDMRVHYGLIASGNKVIKNAAFRNKLRRDLGEEVLCVEMEAAGLMNNFPCIVIRGICDYADSHKNNAWQEHAAALAAAYAKELLCYIQPSDIDREQAVKDVLNSISSAVSSIRKDTIHTRQYLEKKEDFEILDWLIPTNYGSQQTDYFRRRKEGTGEWLLDSNKYRNWVNEPNKTLFCPGIPGAGKTILTSIIVNDLENKFSHDTNDTTVVVSYVYCNYKRHNEQSAENLLSSLLKQLARSLPSLPVSVQQLHSLHAHKHTRPSLFDIFEVLKSVTAQYNRVFVIVDALDECQDFDNCRSQFLSAIFDLQNQTETNVNILVTSRSIPDIEGYFRGTTSIKIMASENDIREYLQGRILELEGPVASSPDLQEEIIKSITEAVGGMFLLAQLHFDSLTEKFTIGEVRTALRKLATGSNAYDIAYAQAMARIGERTRGRIERAKQVLSWVTCAKRPLTKRELEHALAVQIDEPEFNKDNVPQVEHLVSQCAGLVTIDQRSDMVRLVHYTAQDYFSKTQDQWFPDIHLSMTRVCITYLSYRTFENPVVKPDPWLYPLYAYAAKEWGHHAREAPSHPDVLSFLRKLSQVRTATQTLMEIPPSFFYQEIGCSPTRTGLHLAAYFGLTDAIRSITSECDVNDRDNYRRAALIWGARYGQEAVVNLQLTTEGLDPNVRDKKGWTPLVNAVEWKRESVLKLLLSTEGIDLNSRTNDGKTPLMTAAIGNWEAGVRMLLDAGADTNAVDRYGDTALHYAVSMNGETVVRMLIEADADTNVANKVGRTAFDFAVYHRYHLLERLLLDFGAVPSPTYM